MLTMTTKWHCSPEGLLGGAALRERGQEAGQSSAAPTPSFIWFTHWLLCKIEFERKVYLLGKKEVFK